MVEEAFGDGDDGAESTEDRCGVSETPVGIWEGEAAWGGDQVRLWDLQEGCHERWWCRGTNGEAWSPEEEWRPWGHATG